VCTLLGQEAATKFKSTNGGGVGGGDHVEFEQVHIFPLPNSLAYTDQVFCRSSYADQMTCRRDMSQRFDAAV